MLTESDHAASDESSSHEPSTVREPGRLTDAVPNGHDATASTHISTVSTGSVQSSAPDVLQLSTDHGIPDTALVPELAPVDAQLDTSSTPVRWVLPSSDQSGEHRRSTLHRAVGCDGPRTRAPRWHGVDVRPAQARSGLRGWLRLLTTVVAAGVLVGVGLCLGGWVAWEWLVRFARSHGP